jgi:tetratricopeptide (TPR) repeat protein
MLYKSGDEKSALEALKLAEKSTPDYCFPHQVEAVPALSLAIKLNPEGAKAHYYLGNFWYNARNYNEALSCFEKSAELDRTFPTVFRNLALAYYNKFNQPEKALVEMEKVFELDQCDARILMELDQLYKRMNRPVNFRLEFLEEHLELVEDRDDLYLERIELYILKKSYQEAYDLIMRRRFHPWEGGEGKVSSAYVKSLTGLAEVAVDNGYYQQAIKLLETAKVYPENLGEGKLQGAQENKINYWLGCAWKGLRKTKESENAWIEASKGPSEPAAAWYYNDQQPDAIFYQGIALLKLGRKNEALSRFNKLIDYGEKHLFDEIKIDYFAVSLPDLQIWEENLDRRNRIHCLYIMGLGYKGKGMIGKANEYFREVLDADQSHSGTVEHFEELDSGFSHS